ncbi:MAG: alpha/beta fold hydrolase [Chlamydiales bacterium]|nr:alpha/beta fold hydrolase [Chlamydiales bacterium]
MKLAEIYEKAEQDEWILWKEGRFSLERAIPNQRRLNRETLARVYVACVDEIKHQGNWEEASRYVRALWIEEGIPGRPKSLPRIIGEDPFVRMYAFGKPLPVALFHRIWKRLGEPIGDKTMRLNPIRVEWNAESSLYFDEDATPPGILPKLFITQRLKKDKEQLDHICRDLARAANIEDPIRRRWLTLAILSHGAAYREIEGKALNIPSFTEAGKLIAYRCRKHLIAEGVRTVSLAPIEEGAIPIYLCQGTELWPSQPTMIGSIMANFATHGSATAAYAHSWRRIHKHLRDLHNGDPPIVAGHSMGGALAMQIGLYSHDLIERVYAFNPPVPNNRDYDFYHSMDKSRRDKIVVAANLDDFAFWRIGAKVIGNVTVFLGKRRWRYYPVGLLDCLLLIPAVVKFILNVRHAFPAHQNIVALSENWISFVLTQEEIERENQERPSRFDYLRFFPKLYDPMKTLFRIVRRWWRMEAQYLRNEIEIIALHERDLIDTMTDDNEEEIMRELRVLHEQKERLRRKLFRR